MSAPRKKTILETLKEYKFELKLPKPSHAESGDSQATVCMTLKDYKEIREALQNVTVQDVLATDDNNQNVIHYILSNKFLNFDKEREAFVKQLTSNAQAQQYKFIQFPKVVLLQSGFDGAAEQKIIKESDKKPQDEITKKILSCLLKPFKSRSAEVERIKLLTDKDISGSTIFHYYFSSLSSSAYKAVFDFIANDDSLKLVVATCRDANRRNIFHIITAGWNLNTLTETIKIFGNPAVHQAIFSLDINGNTAFHTLCGSKSFAKDKPEQLKNLIALEDKNNPAIKAIMLGNNNDKNVLHLACAAPADNKEVCELLMNELTKEVKDGPKYVKGEPKDEKEHRYVTTLKARDKEGNTPLHCAAAAGKTAVLEKLLSSPLLSSEDITNILGAETIRGENILHLTCQHGDQKMLDFVLRSVPPSTAYKWITDSKDALKILASDNSKMTSDEMQKTIDKYTVLMGVYYYLRETADSSDNYILRRDDFCQCLIDKLEDMDKLSRDECSFEAKDYGFYQGTARYHSFRTKIESLVKREQADTFLAFLAKQESCKVAESIMLGVNSLLVPKNAPSKPTPKFIPLEMEM